MADHSLPPGSWASSEASRAVMLGNRGRDTSPELALRRALHRLGYRYRVDHPPIPELRRRADLVFTRRRVAVFVDGCYWHGCPQHYGEPSTNAEYWRSKIARNRERDADTDARLRQAGWTPVRIWEHESVDDAVVKVACALDAPG
ncbi:very short patch repair endonuclease [Egibacter rhizosphaerae]|uniref:Very short patch repair endonuclease n=1 Tax=Egibacter rhizosphaerae TaxID=1670831 RepID=A0A411YEI4_9ACTN|nr:very short patch repair endonuclease [Egibacter rhizosphaerae]QBI19507.1 very short patch repair endonuclease [Egibacter rhizosphaerae]